jgi:murein DD-endopeptidase MepM/ murein hydrolase activator NlpD
MEKYAIPFPKGTKWKEVEPEGMFAHKNFEESYYAKDLVVEKDTKVLAARGGTVWKVKYDSVSHVDPETVVKMPVKKAMRKAALYTNYVCIDHGDGTYAEYLHLAEKPVVAEGEKVRKGQHIGYVGMSGITSRPHLHFNVFMIKDTPAGKKGYSIPFEWEKR